MHLITGGLGFIGNELARQLKDQTNVAILDNRNRVAPRIDDLSGVAIYEADLTDHARVRTLIGDLKPEVVYHLAAVHFIPECNADPERTLRINVEGTQGLLRTCAATRVKHVLVASSGAVYADVPGPLTESSRIGPVDIYGWSKWFTEQLCHWHAEADGLKISVLRFFNNYGPRETNAHIIPEIINQLRSGDVLSLGNIKPRRDYIHTSDTAKVMRLLSTMVPESLRTVNVASGEHASVEELIILMGKLLNRSITIETDPSRFRKTDKMVQVADIRHLESLLNWRPEIGFRAGLEDLLKFEGLLS